MLCVAGSGGRGAGGCVVFFGFCGLSGFFFSFSIFLGRGGAFFMGAGSVFLGSGGAFCLTVRVFTFSGTGIFSAFGGSVSCFFGNSAGAVTGIDVCACVDSGIGTAAAADGFRVETGALCAIRLSVTVCSWGLGRIFLSRKAGLTQKRSPCSASARTAAKKKRFTSCYPSQPGAIPD